MPPEFQVEVIERLTRLETKIDNGINRRLGLVEEYIKLHPAICPWINRRREMLYLAAVVGGSVAVIELAKYVLELLK